MKTCSKCKTEKSITEFNKAARYEDGLRYDCKHCQSEYRKLNFIKNRDKQLAQSLDWKNTNKDSVLTYASNWKINNRARASSNEMRRHAKKVSTDFMRGDEWNDFFIDEVYDLSRNRSSLTGIKWEVDHIIPLQGKLVNGFHVWYNLQCIPASINRSKSNR